jgi:hypothetical protein
VMNDLRGPLFDGQADQAAADLCDRIEREVAAEGARMVRNNLHGVLRNPTGYYESHVQAEPTGGDWEVTDNGVVYGPWLEGTGSRNRTTRFKGYSTFRRTAQELERRADGIAERAAPEYVRRMG